MSRSVAAGYGCMKKAARLTNSPATTTSSDEWLTASGLSADRSPLPSDEARQAHQPGTASPSQRAHDDQRRAKHAGIEVERIAY